MRKLLNYNNHTDFALANLSLIFFFTVQMETFVSTEPLFFLAARLPKFGNIYFDNFAKVWKCLT